jgi:RNA polymerase sigma-70 factor, ECF subfamily
VNPTAVSILSETETDNALLLRIASKDHAAFTVLFRRHERRLFSLAWRITNDQGLAEQAIQEAMLIVWSRSSHYLVNNVGAWLCRIVIQNSCMLSKQRHHRRRFLVQEHRGNPLAFEREPITAVVAQETKEAVSAAVKELDPDEQRLISLYFDADLSQTEISAIEGVSQRSISKRLERILTALRQKLAGTEFGALAVGLEPTKILRGIAELGIKPPNGLSARILASVFAKPSLFCEAQFSKNLARNLAANSKSVFALIAVAATACMIAYGTQRVATPALALMPRLRLLSKLRRNQMHDSSEHGDSIIRKYHAA